MNPYATPGLLSKGLGLTKAINWTSFLDGTQKTLGVINQAIPIVYQVKPIFSNAKTLFKIANEIKSPSPTINSSPNNDIINQSTTSNTNISSNSIKNSPVFYI